MATRAAIAKRERDAREKISQREAGLTSKKLALEQEMLPYKQMEASANVAKNIVQGAAALQGMNTMDTSSGSAGKVNKQQMSKKMKRDARKAGYTDLSRVQYSYSGNHPEWYKKFVIPETVANLPTYERVGLPTTFVLGSKDCVSGVISFHYIPTLPNMGKSGDSAYYSPVNVGLSRFMAELRKLNSRIGDYDPSDFGLYWYAAADYMTLIEKVRQGIKIHNTYFAENSYFAKAMLEAIGFDADMFVSNIAEIRVLCDKHIKIFNSSIAVPNTLTFFNRRLWMARALIKDRRNAKSQYYVFCPDALGILGEDEDQVIYGSSSPNELRVASYTSLELKFEQMRAALVDSVGIITMIADLRAGIPAGSLLQLDPLDVTALAEPTDEGYDLEQIHNIRTCAVYPAFTTEHALAGKTGVWTKLNIRATDDGYIIQGDSKLNTAVRPTFTPYIPSGDDVIMGGLLNAMKNDFINVYHDDVSQDDILEATRLRHISVNTSTTGVQNPYINGTEIIGYGVIYYYYTSSHALNCAIWGTYMPFYSANAADYLCTIAQFVSEYDWMPPTKIFGNDDDGDITNTWCEFDQYFYIGESNLKKLHEACALSEFFVDSSEFTKFVAR